MVVYHVRRARVHRHEAQPLRADHNVVDAIYGGSGVRHAPLFSSRALAGPLEIGLLKRTITAAVPSAACRGYKRQSLMTDEALTPR